MVEQTTLRPDAVPASDAELLSALIDGELDAAAARDLIGRMCREAPLREHWTWLHVAQEALSAHEVAALALRPAAQRVAGRVALALDQQPALALTRLRRPALAWPWPQWSRHGLQGLLAGAAAAAVALLLVPLLHPGGAERGLLVRAPAPAPALAPVAASAAAAASPARATVGLRARSDDLNDYFAAHRELAGIGLMSRASLAEDR